MPQAQKQPFVISINTIHIFFKYVEAIYPMVQFRSADRQTDIQTERIDGDYKWDKPNRALMISDNIMLQTNLDKMKSIEQENASHKLFIMVYWM